MAIAVKILHQDERSVLNDVAPGVFDRPINPEWTATFLRDSRHHLAVAVEDGRVVGMASAVHYLHPDKPAELWINEVGVALSHQRRGVGKAVLRALLRHGEQLGCVQAWVLTDRGNAAALRLYASVGGTEAAVPQLMFTFPLLPGRPGDSTDESA